MKPLRVCLALSLALVAVAVSAQPRARTAGLVGQVAPRIVLHQPDGRVFDTSTLAGRPYVVDFWSPACGPCRGYVPRLNAAHRRLARVGGAVVGVLAAPCDDREHARIRRTWGIRYPTGTAAGAGDASERYGVERLPAMFAVGADGRVAVDDTDHRRLDGLLLSDELLRVLAPPAR